MVENICLVKDRIAWLDRFFSDRAEIEKEAQSAIKSGKKPESVEEYLSLAMRQQVDSDLLTLLKTLYSCDDERSARKKSSGITG